MTRTNDVWKESNKADRNSNNATATNPEKQHHGPSALRSIWPEKERLADAIKNGKNPAAAQPADARRVRVWGTSRNPLCPVFHF